MHVSLMAAAVASLANQARGDVFTKTSYALLFEKLIICLQANLTYHVGKVEIHSHYVDTTFRMPASFLQKCTRDGGSLSPNDPEPLRDWSLNVGLKNLSVVSCHNPSATVHVCDPFARIMRQRTLNCME